MEDGVYCAVSEYNHNTKRYKDVYIAWNMAFIAQFGNIATAWAALLAPSICGATPEQFVFHRVWGLMIYIQSELYSRQVL
jgi:hypothetical protein